MKRQWFWFILMWLVCEAGKGGAVRAGGIALNKEAAITVVLTEQDLHRIMAFVSERCWTVRLLCLYHDYPSVDSHMKTTLPSSEILFSFLLPLSWLLTFLPGEVWILYSHIRASDDECVGDSSGLSPVWLMSFLNSGDVQTEQRLTELITISRF